jgi:very-short-patch-repair endonuclease
MLQEANILYKKEKTFPNCPFRFDFFVENKYIIEYDGKQHFIDSKWGNTIITKEEAEKKDQEKNNWCKKHNLPIIRIQYTIFNQLTIKDLLLETSSFIIK